MQASDRTALLGDDAFQSRAREGIRAALAYLDQQPKAASHPILRASVLPFRQLKLGARAPALTPTIVPSYANPSDAATAPTMEDLSASIDAPLTDEILAKAKSLDYDYIRIYEFVRDEIRTEWYAGGAKGAVGTLRQKSGNDVDQASLLIALFRASGLPARYIHGAIDLPVEEVIGSLGLRDATQATAALTRAGVAFTPIVRGGRVALVRIEHTWVAAHVPYTNYRGAVVDGSGKAWLPLTPALKRYQVTPSTGLFARAGLGADALMTSYLSTVQPTDPVAVIRKQSTDYLLAQDPTATYEQQLGSISVIPGNIGLLPNTLPVAVAAVTGEGAELTDSRRQRVRFVFRQGAGDAATAVLDYTVPLSDVASERVTLSYIPATVDDHAIMNRFGGLDYVPAYLIKLRPQIKINGRPKAVAEGAVEPGVAYRFEVHLLGPFGSERVDQTVIAGGYHAIGLYAGQVTRVIPGSDPADTEYLAAQLLDRIAWSYTDRWNKAEAELAGLLDVALVRPLPTLAIVNNAVKVDTVLGRPMQLQWQGVALDAALHVVEPIARDGTVATARSWMQLSGLHGSALEHHIFEEEFVVDAISADKGLQLARSGNIPIERITSANIDAIAPTLTHPSEVTEDIRNWARLGMAVEVPRTPIAHNQWQGSVWRVEDPATGAAGYFIAGGLAGGATSVAGGGWLLEWLRDALQAPNSAPPNEDPLAGASIAKIYETDGQTGEVGKVLPTKLAVMVRDVNGSPVVGAAVLFGAVQGEGKVDGAPQVTVITDNLGVAAVTLELGQKTSAFPVYVIRNPGDEYVTKAGFNLIEAAVLTHRGTLAVEAPFTAIGMPQAPIKLVRTDEHPGGGSPNQWSDTIAVQVQDIYENPVSNSSVTFSVGAPLNECEHGPRNLRNAVLFDASLAADGSMSGCPVTSPILGDCGSASLVRQTTHLGAYAGVIMGNAAVTTYFVHVSAAGQSLTFDYPTGTECPTPQIQTVENLHGLAATSEFVMNERGQNINAAKVGEVAKVPTRATLFYIKAEIGSSPKEVPCAPSEGCTTRTVCEVVFYPDRSLVRTVGNVNFQVTNGGSTTGVSAIGNGTYQTYIRTGASPGYNAALLQAEQVQYEGVSIAPPDCAPKWEMKNDGRIIDPSLAVPGDTNFAFGIAFGVSGLLPQITDLQSGGKDPTRLYLNENGQSQYPAQVMYSSPPSTYTSNTTDVDFFQNGAWWDSVIGTARSGNGVGRIPRGGVFDPEKTYEAQLVVNRGSVVEVKSDKFELKVSQKLFKDYTNFLHVAQDVDILNNRICTQGNAFEFTLTEPARVTLTFTAEGDANAIKRIISDEHFDAGTHSRVITVAELPPYMPDGKYTFELTGVSDRDGHEETEAGFAKSEFKTHNRLPVGHVLVKGVDLLDGSLVVGGTDFSVPGRGVPLEFRRNYSSNSDTDPGRLGIGWSHSYESKVIITPCGEAIVIGGEGGGMRFVDDGQGGLRPLKGHHGTLIANQADRTFDFYSKDGTRYHYRNYGFLLAGTPEWHLEFIEDTNGNVTKLGYDPSSRLVAKLITVEDPGKRTLKFTYEDKAFVGYGPLPVIAKVEGPDGISVSFTYDDHGNLVRAARETDARIETYAYATENLPLELRHKLTQYTNPNGHTTNYTYNVGQWAVSPDSIPTFYMPYSFVTAVQEPEGGSTQFDYGLPGFVRRVTDARNNLTTYTLNQYGSPLSIQDPVGTTTMTWSPDDIVMTSKTDANGVRTDFTYDLNANLLSESVDMGSGGRLTTSYTYKAFSPRPIKNRVETKTDRNGHVTRYDYDTNGNLVRMTDAEGGRTEHSYADNGDRTQTKDPNNNVTRFTYDAYGNVETTTNALSGKTSTAWNVRGLPIRVTDALNRTTEFEYDTLNRMTRKRDASGTNDVTRGIRRFTYDAVGNKLTETDEENRTTTWTYDKENRVKSITDARNATKDFTYDLVGNKTRETDWRGNATTYEYDAANRLTKRIEPLGKETAFSYDGVGNVLTETDALNRSTSHAYDGLNRRIRTTDARTGVHEFGYDGVGNRTSDKDPLGRTTTYSYDRLNRLVTKTEPLGKVTTFKYDANGNRIEETDALNRSRKFVFDALNRLVKRTDAENNSTNFEYDAVGNLTLEINARLFKTAHQYDALNRRIKTTQDTGSDVALINQSRGTSVTALGYDKVGNRVEERWPNGNVVQHTYDALNRLTATSDSLGSVLAYEYDANGNRTQETDANGNVTTKTYDALNRLTRADMPENRTVQFEYDLVGNKTAEIDANNNRTGFVYDELNRLTRVNDPLSGAVRYTYDAVGNKLTEQDKRDNTTGFEYDDLNRLVKTTDALSQDVTFAYDAVGNKIADVDKRGTRTEYTYDNENRLTATTKAGVTLVRLEYDELGQKKFETDANGNIVTYIYDDGRGLVLLESRPLAALTRYTYDAIGNRTQVRDPEARTTVYTYDARRRMLTETNGASETTTYTYDGNGNRLTQRRPKGNTWAYTYDNANRLTRITDPANGVTAYTYDGNGNRLTQTDARTNRTSYEYDALNRQTAMIYADSARAEFRYDANGNRTGLTDPKGQIFSYVFDALNRETEKRYPLPATPTGDDIQSIVTQYDANGNPTLVTETYTGATGTRTTTKTYDLFDRMTEVTDGWGKTIRYQYDANGNRTALTDPDNRVTRYTFDALNRVATVTNPGGTTTYTYDRSSLLTQTAYPNGTQAAVAYDGARRQTNVANRQGAAVVSTYAYTYDVNGNRTQQIETNGAAAETTTYDYDTTDRLTEVRYPDKTTVYAYDAAYNRSTERTTNSATQAVEVDKTYAYNNRNQLTGVTDNQNSANNVTYGYDTNGNQTVKTKNGVTTTFVYDVRDQLISVQENATTLGFFRYDFQGMRVLKDMGGQVLRYTYDDQSVLVESDVNDATVAKFDYGTDRLLSLTHATEGRQFYLFDALGSVCNLTTPAGTVQARYQYDAFGNFRAQGGSSFNRFAFTGHEKDNETGLYYFKARFYDPDTARFLTQDAYFGDVNTPPSLHRYLYAYSNPTVYVDLTGYAAFDPFLDKYWYKDFGKQQFELTKKLSEAADLDNTKLECGAFACSTEATNAVYDRLSSIGITRQTASGSAVVLVEKGDTPETLTNFIVEQMGKGFSQAYAANESIRNLVAERVQDANAGDLLNVSDLWGATVQETFKRAAGNTTVFADVYNNPGKIFDGSVPLFSRWLAGYEGRAAIAQDELAPPWLRESSARGVAISAITDALLFATPVKRAGGAGAGGMAAEAGAVTRGLTGFDALKWAERGIADNAARLSGRRPELTPDLRALAESNITSSGITVLGRYNPPPGYLRYTEKAQQRGASYFDIEKSIWDKLTPAEREAANLHFLDMVGKRGDKILLSVPRSKIIPGTALHTEVKYLQESLGYRWVNQWSLQRK